MNTLFCWCSRFTDNKRRTFSIKRYPRKGLNMSFKASIDCHSSTSRAQGEIFVENRLTRVVEATGPPKVLLIGPYDPHCGEYTFLAPPLGVWRLAGVLESAGVDAKVFDPNCCREPPQRTLERELRSGGWDLLGVSTPGMPFPFHIQLPLIVPCPTP